MRLAVIANKGVPFGRLIVGVAGNLLGVCLLLILGGLAGLGGAAVAAYLAASEGLPALDEVVNYRPPAVSTFYADDGTIIGRFFKERRYLVSLDSLPPHVTGAFLAAEDNRFFSHSGVDWYGVVRAAIKNVEARSYAQGASTITQQVVRSVLLTREKRLVRKIREAILAHKLEDQLSKKEILQIYVNQVYFGRGAYGIEAAARTYFGKSAARLGIPEAALLAGIVANPSRYSDPKDPSILERRTETVLKRMLLHGLITRQQYRAARTTKVAMRTGSTDVYSNAPYFTDAVRRYIVQKYGAERLYTDGLRVYTTVDLALQRKATEALIQGTQAWERRHGRPPGLVKKLDRAKWQELRKQYADEAYAPGDLVYGIVTGHGTAAAKKKRAGEYSVALVDGSRYRINLPGSIPYGIGDVLRFGVVEITEKGASIEPYTLPAIEGALVSIENKTGYVRALVGGLDFSRSHYNRAVLGLRQPGSSFKPFVYAAAVESGDYGPETLVFDEPIAVRVSPREPFWVPQNVDGTFQGALPLHTALSRSRNVVAAKLILDMGVDPTIEIAGKMGIASRLRKTLSLSLGTSEATLLDMTSAYSVFANLGWKVDRVVVKKVVDRFGNVIEDNTHGAMPVKQLADKCEYPESPRVVNDLHDLGFVRGVYGLRLASGSASRDKALTVRRPVPARVLSAETADIMLRMLKEVCKTGTASPLAALNRADIGGKTGTSDNMTDAWFIGFDSQYTTGVWIGYDVKESLGKGEHGSEAALPVWKSFMQEVFRNESPKNVPQDPATERPVFLKASYSQSGATDPARREKHKLKSISPVDRYKYLKLPETPAPELVTVTWVPLGYADTRYVGNVRILNSKGKTIGEGYVSDTHKVMAEMKQKIDLWPQQAAAGPGTRGLDRF